MTDAVKFSGALYRVVDVNGLPFFVEKKRFLSGKGIRQQVKF